MRTLRLCRLGGDILELEVSDADMEELHSIRDLKKLLGGTWESLVFFWILHSIPKEQPKLGMLGNVCFFVY